MATPRALSREGLIGAFFVQLGEAMAATNGWANLVSTDFMTDAAQQSYAGLGSVPAMTEARGARKVTDLRADKITVVSEHYSNGIRVPIIDERRDQLGQHATRIQDLARSAAWLKVDKLSELFTKGETQTTGLDNKTFFAKAGGNTGHVYPGSTYTTAQGNHIDVDISTLSVAEHGSANNPSNAEFVLAAVEGVKTLRSLKNDQGLPMNESLTDFAVITPDRFMVQSQFLRDLGAGPSSYEADALQRATGGLTLRPFQDGRMDTANWTTQFVVAAIGGGTSALGWQIETPPMLSALTAQSDEAFWKYDYVFGVDQWAAPFYYNWARAVLVTLV